MASPKLETASKSTRTETEARETRRIQFEKDRAEFHRRLDAERAHKTRAAQNGDDY